MATREENIKKINDELEKLSDEELEKVAGGLMPQNGLRWIQGQRRNEKLSDDELEKIAGGYTWNHWDCIDKPNTDNAQNTPANQLGVKKAIQWIK
ncbi:MAG: hypothetical protein IKI76_09975 [Selenomonadaceae bacterium]|nr:hypothetical protein [Selenomonadaceae bacterium]